MISCNVWISENITSVGTAKFHLTMKPDLIAITARTLIITVNFLVTVTNTFPANHD